MPVASSLPVRGALAVLLTLAFPLLFLATHDRFDARWLAVPLLLVALLRIRRARWAPLSFAGIAAGICAGVLALLTWLMDDVLPAKLYPVLVNVALLGAFAWTLRHPPSAIERFARLAEPQLPPSGVRYTRRLTWVWCAFFAGNGATALMTALWMSDAAWAWYNGCIAYLLMGLLFGGEWLLRSRLRARSTHD